MPLGGDMVRLAKGKNLATVVTLMPDGQPQALLTWIDTDGEHVLVNTEPQRQKARNIARDPRITVLIRGDDNYDWAEVRGHVVETVGGEPARQHIDELSLRYNGHEYRDPIGPQGRMIIKIAADRSTPRRLGRRYPTLPYPTPPPSAERQPPSRRAGLAQPLWHVERVDRPPARPPWRLPRPPAPGRSCGRPASRHVVLGHALGEDVPELGPHPGPEFRQPHPPRVLPGAEGRRRAWT